MQAVAAEMESMVGQQATWTGSGPGSGDASETWASAASESAAPPLSTVTRSTAGRWSCSPPTAPACSPGSGSTTSTRPRSATGARTWSACCPRRAGSRTCVGAPAGRKPLAGDLVFMDGMAHVALATGNVDGAGRADIISFWPPPNTPFTRGGTIDSIKRTTIEELVDWWAADLPPGAARRARRAAVVVAEIRARDARRGAHRIGAAGQPAGLRAERDVARAAAAPAPGRRGPRVFGHFRPDHAAST